MYLDLRLFIVIVQESRPSLSVGWCATCLMLALARVVRFHYT